MKIFLRFCGSLCSRSQLLTVLLFLTGLTAFSQKVFFVTPTGGGSTQDGSSWANAYAGTQLQVAIEEASTYSQANSNQPVQVWVAAGVYKPTNSTDRDISFSMRNHVAIYGGFAGGETTLSDRPTINLSTPSSTTLSGDIGDSGINTDNSYHVISNPSSLSLTTSAVLDGFVITEGNAEGGGGGGMLNFGTGKSVCSPTVRNSCFRDNLAGYGAAMNNFSSNGGTCSPILINCSFINNSARVNGGAIYNFNSSGAEGCNPIVTNCSFTNNSADRHGGVMYNGSNYLGTCSPVVTNCRFTNNSAHDHGGVMYTLTNEEGTCIPVVTNCSFSNNSATQGSVLLSTIEWNLYRGKECKTVVTNSVAWNNGGSNTFDNYGGATTTANYCLFEPSVTNFQGDNNLTTPVSPFVSETTLQLTPCSPALNAGDPASTTATSGTTDLAENPRFYNDGRVDIGAFEFQSASLTPPVVSAAGPTSLTVIQNTPFVNLTVTGCDGGGLTWSGPSGSTGTGSMISVPTSATGTLVYSATCTVGSCTSGPGSATVTISPSLVSGSFDGFVNGADCGTFRGWAWDRNKNNTAVNIEILDGPTVLATLLAGDFRKDLLDAGKGNGKHAFRFIIPDALKDGLAHNLSARVAGSSFILKDSPKALICQGVPIPGGNKPPQPPTPTILIAPLVAQVGVPFSGTLVAFTDPEGTTLSYALSGLPDGLSLGMPSRVISGTPTVAGSFVLTYQATDEGGANNSVSFVLTVNPTQTTTITGDFEGYLDKLDCGGIRGWVWDRKKPSTPLTVEFYTAGGSETVLGSSLANIYRVDLKDAGKGTGAHAYNFTAPAGLQNGDLVRARVLGSSYELKGSPKAYQCASARLSAESYRGLEVTVLGNPVSDQVEVEIRGAYGKFLHLTLTDLNGRLISERLVEQPGLVEHQALPVSKAMMGLLLLSVQSGLQSVTVKLVKP
jgi:hypothetical protein